MRSHYTPFTSLGVSSHILKGSVWVQFLVLAQHYDTRFS
uniref:Uncharacterized protein n=1 Tax=Anguilla anguilla TaxID=7936 RepID=A0A0E9XCP8_ANGAN